MRSRMVAVGNVRLHTVELGGSGSARGSVVIVHGMVVASSGTMPLAAALARRGFVVHVPDLPGFGRPTAPLTLWTWTSAPRPCAVSWRRAVRAVPL